MVQDTETIFTKVG